MASRKIVAFFALVSTLAAADFASRFAEMREAPTDELYALAFALPKGGDLHNHLSLSFFPEMVYRAATDPARTHNNEYFTRVSIQNCAGAPPQTLLYRTIQRSTYAKLSDCEKEEYKPLAGLSQRLKEEWLSAMRIDRPGEGRNEFFEVIVPRYGDLMRSPYLLPDLLVEKMKMARAEGVRYIETQAQPVFVDAEGTRLPVADALRILRERLQQPDAVATGVTVRFQYVAIRFARDAERQIEQAYALVDGNRDFWVGINIAGREDNDQGYALRFLDVFRRMRRMYSGIPLSLHGGEKDSPGHEVRDTLLLGASRIGHGVNLISDPDTMLLMRNGRNLVEVSLVSNQLLEYTPDVTRHPFPEYLRFGIPVCLNTDDPGVWDSNMTDEYYTALKNFRLTWPEVVQIGRNSLVYSFVQPEIKERLLSDYDAAVRAFEAEYGQGDWHTKLRAVRPVTSGYATRTLGVTANR